MHIISRKKLRECWSRLPELETPLRTWIRIVDRAHWQSFREVRETFPAADRVDELYVFNIHGNRYRLICGIDFDWGKVYVGDVLTHAEYDRGRWKPG